LKLAFIVQRYGREIPGGSETLARQIAERLARRHEIDVLTSTARDYVTWRNEYPAGEEKLRGVRILRFPVEAERNLEEFNRFSEWIYHNPHSSEDEIRWLEMQGPRVPQLIEYLRQNQGRYDLLVFFTYLYYPAYHGIPIAPEKTLLVPTAHDEPALKLGIFKPVFELPTALLFNTEAEELLVLDRFRVQKKMRETVGMGMELLDPPDATAFRRRFKVHHRYLLYAGRIDEGKGCGELLSFFRRYRSEHPEANLQLLMMGNLAMKLPGGNEVRYLGFLGEEEKLAAMAGAVAVVVPSRFESLSIVALEAFSVGVPVVVNARSRVLVDHCRKANAGLYYASYEEFEGILDLMIGDKALARTLGRQGQAYIKENFGWDKLLAQYERAFRSFTRPTKQLDPRSRRFEPAPAPAKPIAPPLPAVAAEPPREKPPEPPSPPEQAPVAAPEEAPSPAPEEAPPPAPEETAAPEFPVEEPERVKPPEEPPPASSPELQDSGPLKPEPEPADEEPSEPAEEEPRETRRADADEER
jgi:glycosyltransferase involved in cell wall biosynthesis